MESTEPTAGDTSEKVHRRTTGADIVRGILRRLSLPSRGESRGAQALFTFITGTLSIGLLATVAHVARSPLIFPSLGPTAYLMFHRPLAAASSPKNTLIGHLIGAVCGWLSLAIFGLLGEPSAMYAGVTWGYVGSSALSLGATGGLMAYFRVGHPPAGATTLIVSLGLMPHLWQIPVLMGAILLLTLQALIINRLAGLPYPLWAPIEQKGAP